MYWKIKVMFLDEHVEEYEFERANPALRATVEYVENPVVWGVDVYHLENGEWHLWDQFGMREG